MKGRARRRAALLAAVLGAGAAPALAGRYCDSPPPLSADDQQRLFAFGAVVKAELERSGAAVALIARSGLDLSRFAIRYSHAGLALRDGAPTPWAVRQLYYACDEARPLLFDQGLAAFLRGNDDPALGYVSLLLLPAEAAAPLQQAALDDTRALALLGERYSANAYPFSVDFQNCNQWLAELLAAAWGGAASRTAAQRWLRDAGYAPATVEAGWLAGLTPFVPHLQHTDHPADDVAAGRFRLSLPASIEAFAQQRWPQAQRVEVCHDARRAVVRRGGSAPLAAGCVPAPGDEVTPLR